MGFLDRIRECNTHDLRRFRPLHVAGHRVGWARHDIAAQLGSYPDVFMVTEQSVSLNTQLDSFDKRSAAVRSVLEALRDAGMIPAWREEAYPVATSFGSAPLMQMERAAFPCLGMRAYGVHMNGFVRDGRKLKMWIARRARNKPTFPGMLDNMVAGGMPIGLSLRDNLIKECAEEANIPAELATRAVSTGAISYCKEVHEGLKPDLQFICDLELPAGFEPRPMDGEVEAFYLWPIEKVMEIVASTQEFKFNCALVIIDFLVRHGLITPEDADYLEIVQGLRQ
jgi:isopentenyldiphosphate isomerase